MPRDSGCADGDEGFLRRGVGVLCRDDIIVYCDEIIVCCDGTVVCERPRVARGDALPATESTNPSRKGK